ncbi:MAG TPA: DUF2171 domain-containing protein [Sphingomicrobium sp.]|nr:DUF2171 domain-containing protein [Sphingomicrobium sp.]
MAYDRYDTRRGRSDYDRDRERGDWRGDYDSRGRRDDRGFFERAGDEIASWFGDEDAERRRRHDERMERGPGRDRDYDRDRQPYGRSRGDHDRGRFEQEDRKARPMNWTSSDRDYRSGYAGYDRDYTARGGLSGTSRDYMSPTGPSFGYGGSFGAGTDRGYGSGGWGSEYGGNDRDRDRGYRPMTGDYGRSESPYGRDEYRRTSHAGSGRDNDRHYDAWRQRQMDELDRDYDDYHRERQQKFEQDFGSWRETRQQKRGLLGNIREHMDVVGSDGESVGKVDCVKGDRVVLTKGDSDDNRHHSIKCSMIDGIEDDQVKLDIPAEEAKSRLRDEDRGLFGGRDEEVEGVSLERSFSGTYR